MDITVNEKSPKDKKSRQKPAPPNIFKSNDNSIKETTES